MITDKSGKKSWEVKSYQGSFAWQSDSVSLEIDPNQVEIIHFGIFLAITGELSLDDINVDWL